VGQTGRDTVAGREPPQRKRITKMCTGAQQRARSHRRSIRQRAVRLESQHHSHAVSVWHRIQQIHSSMKLHCPFLSACAVVLTLSTPIAASASASVVSLTYSTVGCTGTPLTNTSYPAGECLPQTGDKAGLSVKTFCTDAYSYAVDYQDAACTTAVAIARVRIGECADGQLTQCLNSAAGPAFPLTFPVDGWTYQTKYFNADHSVASCPLTSSPSAPLSNTQEVSIQLGVCIPRPLKRASAIYACANNGANLGGTFAEARVYNICCQAFAHSLLVSAFCRCSLGVQRSHLRQKPVYRGRLRHHQSALSDTPSQPRSRSCSVWLFLFGLGMLMLLFSCNLAPVFVPLRLSRGHFRRVRP
jgi:hypothetical protein